jgi:anti-sigma-K factor RskA
MEEGPQRERRLRWPSKGTWRFVAEMVAAAASVAVSVYTAVKKGG